MILWLEAIQGVSLGSHQWPNKPFHTNLACGEWNLLEALSNLSSICCSLTFITFYNLQNSNNFGAKLFFVVLSRTVNYRACYKCTPHCQDVFCNCCFYVIKLFAPSKEPKDLKLYVQNKHENHRNYFCTKNIYIPCQTFMYL